MSKAIHGQLLPDDHPDDRDAETPRRSNPWRRGRVLALRDKVEHHSYVIDADEVAESMISAAGELLPESSPGMEEGQ